MVEFDVETNGPPAGEPGVRAFSGPRWTRVADPRRRGAGHCRVLPGRDGGPDGGWQSHQAACGAVRPEYKHRTFVVLRTSHYGQPERFGMTRKPFVTPLGESAVDLRMVDTLVND